MAVANLSLKRVENPVVLKDRIYQELKSAITSMNVYADDDEHRLDERQLSLELGVSRTPVREALCRLENEGFVHTIPRRGAFVARKTKKEVLEMITVWAALESMAARLITENASAEEIATLREMFSSYDDDGAVQARIDEYSEINVSFHQALFRLSRCDLLSKTTENLFLHMRSIRMRTIAEKDRASRSIIDHMYIIEALEARDTELRSAWCASTASTWAGMSRNSSTGSRRPACKAAATFRHADPIRLPKGESNPHVHRSPASFVAHRRGHARTQEPRRRHRLRRPPRREGPSK